MKKRLNTELSSLKKLADGLKKERLNIELSCLRKLAAGLKTLEENQLNYDQFVSEYDKVNQCGTVCCAWGWMPKFVPESGVKWHGSGAINILPSDFFREIERSKVNIIFLGYDFDDHDSDKFGDGDFTNLQQVINRIEYIISVYEKNK